MYKLAHLIIGIGMSLSTIGYGQDCSINSSEGYSLSLCVNLEDVVTKPGDTGCEIQYAINYEVEVEGITQSEFLNKTWVLQVDVACVVGASNSINIDLLNDIRSNGTWDGTSVSGSILDPDKAYVAGSCSDLTLDCSYDFTVQGAGINWTEFSCQGCASSIGATAAPVDLLEFKGSSQDETIEIHWTTANEVNNQGFFIQRLTTQEEWEAIGFVEGIGTSLMGGTYRFTDLNPLPGKNYYRLKQVDYNGDFELFKVIEVLYDFYGTTGFSAQMAYPSPIQDVLYVEGIKGPVQIFDQKGRIVYHQLGKTSLQQIETHDWPRGMYVLHYKDGYGTTRVQKLIK
ncbi:MAG: T9SS type A sorting domain-containing protein [Bacteroidota bacterium]